MIHDVRVELSTHSVLSFLELSICLPKLDPISDTAKIVSMSVLLIIEVSFYTILILRTFKFRNV